eukprot:m.39909 g.39909  ORF g.39909 m.39909 type:complete len:140 (-) comp12714_c0_seq1:779-1198(-)
MADDYTLSKDCNLGWHQQGMVALVVYDCGRRVSVASSIARLFPVDKPLLICRKSIVETADDADYAMLQATYGCTFKCFCLPSFSQQFLNSNGLRCSFVTSLAAQMTQPMLSAAQTTTTFKTMLLGGTTSIYRATAAHLD